MINVTWKNVKAFFDLEARGSRKKKERKVRKSGYKIKKNKKKHIAHTRALLAAGFSP